MSCPWIVPKTVQISPISIFGHSDHVNNVQDLCRDQGGEVCGGRGDCVCGECQCQAGIVTGSLNINLSGLKGTKIAILIVFESSLCSFIFICWI